MRALPYRALFLLAIGTAYALVGLVLIFHTATSDLPVFRSFPDWLDDNEHGALWLAGGLGALTASLYRLFSKKTNPLLEKVGFTSGLIPPLFSAIALATLISVIPPGAMVLLLLCAVLSAINLIVAAWPDPKLPASTQAIPLPPNFDGQEN